MSEIIYLKDILPRKSRQKKIGKTVGGRPKLKPFKYEKIMKSSLMERRKKEDIK
jgi:hypothetical protein